MTSIFTPTNQIRFTNVAVVRHKIKGKKFEVACYRNKIAGWRSGIETKLEDVIQSNQVFKDVATGSIATKKELLETFGTEDIVSVIKKILTNGTYQMSDKEREEALSSIFKTVASTITSSVVSPQNNMYPQSMIEKALKEVHFKVNLGQNIRKQVKEGINKIKTILPIVEFKMIVRILVENTDVGEEFTKKCLEYSDEVVSDEVVGGDKQIILKIKPENFHQLDLLANDQRWSNIQKTISIDKYHNIDRIT
ncbi:Ribosome maturation protein SBDS [Thelohanellus kitauei]|uniref:Ribosome maturation protein SBDS n=1 Tax=Thelohanellus kitauei TaxID=669202 RepID=A0A0C2MIC4_THEKT|nr:Ribosome maturation protein SBDS [Thelohanellus kitauei]